MRDRRRGRNRFPSRSGDILLANEIACEQKAARLAALATQARISVAADALEQVANLGRSAKEAAVTLDVLIDLDVGLARCGVQSASEAVKLAEAVTTTDGLRLAGLMAYEGRLRASNPVRAERLARLFDGLSEVREALAQAGFEPTIVSAAGTSTLLEALKNPLITEIQAGTYALMESDLEGLGLPFECAVSVAATVISKHRGHVVVDAGRKTVGCDYGLPTPLLGGLSTISVIEEHTVIAYSGKAPQLGDRIELRPSNIRTTFNLHEGVWLLRGDEVIDYVSVAARGRSV